MYVGVLAFLVLWAVAGLLISDPQNEWLAMALDPFGIRALERTTRYFSPFELNTRLPDFQGPLLLNRAIWSVISVALFGATLAFFKPQRQGTGRRWFGKAKLVVASKHVAPVSRLRAVPPAIQP